MNEHDGYPELTDAQKARWQATVSDAREMAADLRDGTATQEDMQGALNRLASCDIDRDTLINSLHVPPDAGPYAPALERILRRIPDGWGRWISHDAGWYPIVVTCDERLAVIDPDYAVHQIKEKFGTLRYYCAPSGNPATDMWDAFDDVTSDAERASAITCELCGERGSLRKTSHLLKTLCTSCADTLGKYTPAPLRDDR